jgi:hypothetical protein
VVVVRGRDSGLTLPVDPPTPASLARMDLSAAASWANGIEGYVEIEAVLDARAPGLTIVSWCGTVCRGFGFVAGRHRFSFGSSWAWLTSGALCV